MVTIEEKIDEVRESLKTLQKDVQQIKDKTSAKWVLPVIMLFLTVVTGVISYYLQKEVDLDRKVEERLAELRADRVGNFFNEAAVRIEDLSIAFESYTRFGDQHSDSLLNLEMAKFYHYYTHVKDINPAVLKKMEDYSRFVSESKNRLETQHLSPKWKDSAEKAFLKSQKIKQALQDHIKREEESMS